MSSIQLAANSFNTIVDTIQPIYTAPEFNTVLIEAFTASNTSSVNAAYSVYITAPDGTEQPQIPYKVLVWGENDLGIGVVNQVIPAGGTLSVTSSALNSIYFTVTGRVL